MNRTRVPTRTRAVRALALAAAGAVLAGCGSLPQPRPEAVEEGPRPAVLPAQVDLLLPEVEAAVEAAEQANDPALADARTAGPVATALAARAAVRTATQQPGPAPDAQSWEQLGLVSPLVGDYPAFFLAPVQVPGRQVPSLLALTSPSARDRYELYADMQLLPGAVLPETAPPAEGSEVLAPDAQGLALTPADAAARYADVLTNGPQSAFAAEFADDALRQQVMARRDADRSALQAVADVTTTHAVVPDRLFAVRTADGGALVVAELTSTTEVRLRPGAGTVRVEPDLAALAGRADFASAVTTTSTEVVALAVPPAGGGQVQAVAAQQEVTAVQGS